MILKEENTHVDKNKFRYFQDKNNKILSIPFLASKKLFFKNLYFIF
jgi:hypothetical protein